MPQPPITDLDQGFVGVNGRTDPALTQQGLVSSAKNRRFIKGVATTRRGVKILPWSNKASGFYENVAYATGDIVRFSGLKIEGGTGDAATVITTPAEAYNGVTPNADPDGPSSNRLAGPYFERTSLNSGSSQGQLPVTAYNTSGPAVTVNTSYWTDKGALVFKYGTVYGAGVFRTPNDIEWLVVATTTGVFITQENNASEELKVDGKTYAASADSTHYTDLITGSHDRVTFVQCFEKLIMFRGKDDAPLELSEDLAAGFKIVGKEESEDVDENPNGTGLESIPNADTGVYFGNRLVVPHGRDEIAVSDYLNYTAFEPTRSSLRVNVGSSDSLKAVFKFDPNTLIVFKTGSVYAVRNLYGDLAGAYLDLITDQYGLKASKSLAAAGKDLIFLSDQRGVVSLQMTESGQTQGVDVPLSEPISNIIENINWTYADNAVGVYHDNKYFLAVPLKGLNGDNPTENNAVLVYDFINKAWSGIDHGDAIGKLTGSTWTGIREWILKDYRGARRLFFISSDGTLGLYDDNMFGGYMDEVINTTTNKVDEKTIATELVTRGYGGSVPDMKRFQALSMGVASWYPNYSVSILVDGVEESVSLVTDKKFDRTKYQTFADADYVATNANNDFHNPNRQDYSVAIPFVLGSKGVTPDLKQSWMDRHRFLKEGRFAQVKITTQSDTSEYGVIDIKELTILGTQRARTITSEAV
jgi:hypothetical protein